MASPHSRAQRVAGAARSGIIGAIVAAVAFFDGVFVGMPIAVLSASLRPLLVFVCSAAALSLLSIFCCSWVDRRWDAWLSGHGQRIEKRLESMRASRLMRHPVAWVERGSDRWYAFAAALANPVLMAAIAKSLGQGRIGERRILLGSVAYAVPYAAMWTLVGLVLGDVIRAA
ncbi:MAG TPA: hypothetical protein VEH52_03360 [Gaiellaceae bacterium]|nr:hypothetical protein [Gaiellaceae bacterium]